MLENIDEFDVKTGQTIKTYRLLNGLSQVQLGQQLQVSFQQVQKYERGVNRVSVAMFEKIRQALNIPLHKIFTDVKESNDALEADPLDMALISKIAKITDPKKKKAIVDLIHLMSREGP